MCNAEKGKLPDEEDPVGSPEVANCTFGKECWRIPVFKLRYSSLESGKVMVSKRHLALAKHMGNSFEARG
jgi:hypothetical protein